MVKQKWLIWCLVACFLFAIPCEVNAGQKDISGADLLKNRYETQMKANVVTLEEIKMQDEILEMYSMIDEKIKNDEENSASYAGGYIDAKGNLVVCTTSKEYKRKIEYCVKEEIEAEKMEYIETDNVKYQVVEYSAQELEQTQSKMDDRFSSLDRVSLSREQASLIDRLVGYGIDYENNCIDVGITDYSKEDIVVFESIFGEYEFVKYHEEEAIVKQSSYQPGHAIYVITGKDGEEIRRERLSIGYKAYKKTSSGNINGFVTCAHGVYEAISSNIYIGTDFDEDDIIGTAYENGFTVSYGNLNKHDYSFIKLVQGVTINHIDPASTNSNQSTIATIVQGMKVYKTGSSTATTSSTIALVNFSASYPDYPGFVMVHLAKTSSRFATQGDSGGLVYTDNLNVAGIISGGSTTATLFLRASEIKSSHNVYPL